MVSYATPSHVVGPRPTATVTNDWRGGGFSTQTVNYDQKLVNIVPGVLTNDYRGGGFWTQTVGGLQPPGLIPPNLGERSTVALDGGTQQQLELVAAGDLTNDYRGGGFWSQTVNVEVMPRATPEVYGERSTVELSSPDLQPRDLIAVAALIPTTFFHQLRGTAVDEEGDPITNARWLVAADVMPQAAPVDENGEYAIWLLRQDYRSFFLTVYDPDRPDMVWYEATETVALATDDEKDIVFQAEEAGEVPDQARGLMAGHGVSMG